MRLRSWKGRAVWALSLPLIPLLFGTIAAITPAGKAWIAGRATSLLNGQIRGEVRAASLGIGFGSVRLEGVEILAPDGSRVADAEELEVSIRNLAPGGVRLGEVRVVGARILAAPSADGGIGLLQAFEPPASSLSGGSSDSSFWLQIDRLVIERASVVVRGAKDEPVFTATDVGLDVSGRVDGRGAQIAGTARGRLQEPSLGELELELDAALGEDFRTLALSRLAARRGASSLSMHGEADLGEGDVTLRSLEASVAPADLASLGVNVSAPVKVSGDASLSKGSVHAELRAGQGEGSLDLVGDLALASGRWTAVATAVSLDPRLVDPGLPNLTFAGRIEATGRWLDDLSGRVTGGRVASGTTVVEPIELEVALQGERIDVEKLSAAFPGGRIGARGWVEGGAASLRFELDARAAGRFLAAVSKLYEAAGLGRLELPAVTGAVAASGTIQGRLDTPRIDARLRSSSFTWGEATFTDVAADGSLSGLPGKPAASFKGTIGRFETTGTAIADVRADLALSRGRAKGQVEGRSPFGRVHATLDAGVADDFSSLRFDALELGWPGASWKLDAPARLTLAPRLRAEPMRFTSDDGGTLAARFEVGRDGRPEVELEGAGLDLGALPPGLVPPEARLAGKLGLVLRLEKGVILADATLSSLGADGLAKLSGLGEPLVGLLDARIHLEGPLESPLGSIRLEGRDLRGYGVRNLGLRADASWPSAEGAKGRKPDRVELSLDAWTGPTALHAQGAGSLDLGRLLRAPSAEIERALAAPIEGEASVDALEVGAFAGRFGLPAGLRGKVDLTLGVAGSARAPRVKTVLRASDLWDDEVGPLDGELAVDATAEEVRVTLSSSLLGRRFVDGEASLGGPIERLGDWKNLPLRAAFSGSAIDLPSVVHALGHRGGRRRGGAEGRLEASLQVSGTLASPEATLHAKGAKLGWGGATVGSLAIDGRYASGRLDASARLAGAGGGSATLDASWQGELHELMDAPIEARLRAAGLDLTFASVLSPDLRQIAGRLDADLEIRGTAGELGAGRGSVEGVVSLRSGRLSYTGLGDLRDVELDLELHPDRAILRHLQARSSGLLKASGLATRKAPGEPFAIEGTIEARRFGVVSNDLVRAIVDADGKLRASFSGGVLDGRLELSSTSVDLPNTPGKNVQELEGHPDFHFGDAPVAEKQAAARREKGPLQVHLDIATTRPATLRGIDLALEANAALRLNYEGSSASLAGTIETVKGGVIVMGRRFELSRGRVIFTGSEALSDPRLDVVAVQESPYAKVIVTIGGTAQRFTADLRSNPPMSEAEIATLLATGRPQLKRGAGGMSEASGAASALGAVVTSQLKRGLATKLPVDVISFQAGEDGLDSGSLEAGSYVTDRIFVGYSRNFGVADTDRRNINEVRVEYQLTPRWTLEVTYGDKSAGGADLFWTRDF
ncbi:translocation/assembly module TamB domain-containing protein [Vulgatibacter incomptus]|uniref:Translocation and assembly module TamB C-terminal domain-containing protein n=1 Tax=Vulgatibacter incomptus TaxID=1391653 RepID=A0A0K1PFL3_9BACT|nr:translocation/assembly module TamB domain-containing protein [Vulgatibacter incomptus]AKU92323.1 hypothetical protein AKJ08_2710 [Vulgatibacter incomptus]